VGFAAIQNKGSVTTTLHASAKLPKDVLHAENHHALGIIGTVAVLEPLQGHGIGEQLFLAMERTLSRSGASLIAVPAWEDPNGAI
jgi:predicted N-acetyltransferase YhbS